MTREEEIRQEYERREQELQRIITSYRMVINAYQSALIALVFTKWEGKE